MASFTRLPSDPFAAPATVDPITLRGRGSGCASPGLGCARGEYAVKGGQGYLRPGYDTGRWWLEDDPKVRKV